MKKRVILLLKCWHNFLHYCLTVILTVLFFLCVCVFVFVVFVKVDPVRSEKIISRSVIKIATVLNVDVNGVATKVEHGVIKIGVKYFAKKNNKITLIGDNALIEVSLRKLWQGTLYGIEIEKFVVKLHDVQDGKNNSFSESESLSKYYYSIIPSLKILIKDFVLNMHGNILTLQNAKLSVNEMQYVLSVRAHSVQDKYRLNILLDSKKLYIYFNGVPSSLLHRYTDAFKDIDFESISGEAVIDVHNIGNVKFSCIGDDIKILKGRFVAQDLPISTAQISGSIDNGDVALSINNVKMLNGTEARVNFTSKGDVKDIDVLVKNIETDVVESYLTDYISRASGIYSTIKYLTGAISGGFAPKVSAKVHLPTMQQSDVAVNVEFENTAFVYYNRFAHLYEANGTVEVDRDYTTVNVKSAKSGNNIIENSRAVLNHNNLHLDLSLLLSGTPSNLANTFDVSADYSNIDALLHGNAKVQTFIGIDLTCNDVYACTNINGNAKFEGVSLPFAAEAVSGIIKVSKAKNKSMGVNIAFDNFSYRYFNIKEITGSYDLYVNNGFLEIKDITVKDLKGSNILGVNLLKIPFKDKLFVEKVDVPLVNFNGNDFGIKVVNEPQEKSLGVSGNSLSVPVLLDVRSDFSKYLKGGKDDSPAPSSDASLPQINVALRLDKVSLFNGVETFVHADIIYKDDALKTVDIDSDLMQYYYYSADQKTQTQNEEQDDAKRQPMLSIPDLRKVFLAANTANVLQSGTVKVYGEYNDDGSIAWKGDIHNVHISVDKFHFKPKSFKVKALLKDKILTFDNVKIHDSNYTVFITGRIFTDTMQIKSNLYYTPSKIELLNNVPILSKAISITTLGQNYNGLVSLEFEVYGSIFKPEVKFNKASPIKSLWKFSFGVLLLPFLFLF